MRYFKRMGGNNNETKKTLNVRQHEDQRILQGQSLKKFTNSNILIDRLFFPSSTSSQN